MKLFLIHLGFYDPELGIYEMHINKLVAAPDAKTAKANIKHSKIFVDKNMHVDGIEEISMIDGYRISLEKISETESTGNKIFGYDAVKALG